MLSSLNPLITQVYFVQFYPIPQNPQISQEHKNPNFKKKKKIRNHKKFEIKVWESCLNDA